MKTKLTQAIPIDDQNREQRISQWCWVITNTDNESSKSKAFKAMAWEIKHRSKGQIKRMERAMGLDNGWRHQRSLE